MEPAPGGREVRETRWCVVGTADRVRGVTADAATDGLILARLEGYYDLAPRGNADTEEHGPLTLFVSRGGYPYYARPRLGLGDDVSAAHITAADVEAVLARQRELGLPRNLEWVDEVTPTLLAAARSAGLQVEECPLLVLDGEPAARPVDAEVRLVEADDPDLGRVHSCIGVGFATGGTALGKTGVAERDADLAAHPDGADRAREASASGRTFLVGAFDAVVGAVGGGSYNPRGDVAEIVGVAMLPAYRRRGYAGAVTSALARHALDHGVTTVFCSAQSADVARVYEAVGFRRVGTACIAEAD